MAGLAAALFIRSKRAMVVYGAFVAVLAIALYLVEPDERKLAYWGAMLPVVLFVYHHIASEIAQQQQLEDKVLERTQQLSEANEHLRDEIEEKSRLEEALRFSQKMEALGRMAGGIAHEFNNLLAGIQGYAVLATRESEMTETESDYLQSIHQLTERAANLTRQLLAFARKPALSRQPTRIDELLRSDSRLAGRRH